MSESEDCSGHLGGKRANCESGFRPREGEAPSPGDAFPGPPVTAHSLLPVAPSGRAWPWEGPCPRPRPLTGRRARPPRWEKKARPSVGGGGEEQAQSPCPALALGRARGLVLAWPHTEQAGSSRHPRPQTQRLSSTWDPAPGCLEPAPPALGHSTPGPAQPDCSREQAALGSQLTRSLPSPGNAWRSHTGPGPARPP